MKKNNESSYAPSKETPFCYARLDTDERVFADEALRIRLVRTLGPAAAAQGCTVAAFCILEDSVHLLLHTDYPRRTRDRDAVHRMLTDQDLALPRKLREEGLLRERSTGWAIHNGEEAAHFCSDIHLTALRKGYASELNSYWFSSWQTYRGAYYWSGLRTESVLEAFSEDPKEAADLFRQYQKRQAHTVRIPKEL